MGAINRVPKGFLGLLDAKTLGVTPGASAEGLQPVVDLTSFYWFDIPLRAGQATETKATIGEYARVTVPDSEAWLVYTINVNGTAAAVGTGAPYLSVRVSGPGLDQADLNQERSATLAIGETAIASVSFGGTGRLFTGGSTFQGFQANSLGGNLLVSTMVHYRPVVV